MLQRQAAAGRGGRSSTPREASACRSKWATPSRRQQADSRLTGCVTVAAGPTGEYCTPHDNSQAGASASATTLPHPGKASKAPDSPLVSKPAMKSRPISAWRVISSRGSPAGSRVS